MEVKQGNISYSVMDNEIQALTHSALVTGYIKLLHLGILPAPKRSLEMQALTP